MRGMWTLMAVVACVVAGLTGLASAIAVSQLTPASSPSDPAAEHPLLRRIENLPSLVEPLQAGLGLDTAPDQTQPAVPRVSTATRHVRTPEEAAMSGELHPATDRVMALLVGWVLLASLGGGLLAPRN